MRRSAFAFTFLFALGVVISARLVGGVTSGFSGATAAVQGDVPSLMRTTFTVRDFHPKVDRTGPINWIARNPNDVNEVFASSMWGGLWRSADRGFHWQLVSTLPSRSVSAVAFMFDGTPGGAVLVTTQEDFSTPSGAGVWRSDDHGRGWKQVGRVSDGRGCPSIPRAYSIAVRDTRAWVATNCGVLASTDGRTFDMLPAGVFARGSLTGDFPQYFYSVEVTPSGAVLLGGEGGIVYQFTRATGPAGMSLSMTGDSGEMHRAFGVSPSRLHPEFVLALSGSQGTHTILISRDSGRTWSAVRSRSGSIGGGAGGSPFIRMVPSVNDPNDLFVYHGDSYGLAVAGPFRNGDLSPLADNPRYPWRSITVGHPDPHDIDFSEMFRAPVPLPTRLWFDAEGRRRPTERTFRQQALLMATDGGLEICRFATTETLPVCREAAVLGPDTGLTSFQVMRVNGQIIGSGESARRRVYVQTWHTDRYVTADEAETWTRIPGEGSWLDMERRIARAEDAQVVINNNATPNMLADDQLQHCGNMINTTGVVDSSPPLLLRRGAFLQVDSIPGATTLMASSGVSFTPSTPPSCDATTAPAIPVTWRSAAALQVCDPATRLCAPVGIQDPLILGGVADAGRRAVLYQPFSGGLQVIRGAVDRTGLTGVTASPASMKWRDSSGVDHWVLQGIAWMPGTGFGKRTVVAVDPVDPAHLLIPDVVNDRVMQSFNSGGWWSPVDALSTAVTQDATGRTTSIFKIDRGDSGKQTMISAISFYPEFPNLVVAGTVSNGLFFSDDRGATWRRIPGTTHITNVVDLYWRSASSVIAGSWGRGVFEIQMRHVLPPSGLRLICGDCRFLSVVASREPPVLLSIRPQQATPNPPAGQVPAFDEAILIVGGSINGVEVSQGRLQRLSATIGSSTYHFGGPNTTGGPAVEERSGFHGFAGLPAADPLRDRKQIIRGVALTNGSVTHVIYGPTEVPQPAPSPLPQMQTPPPPAPQSPPPFLRIVGRGVVLGAMAIATPFELQGYFFEPDSLVAITVDGRPAGQGQTRTDGRGQFTIALAAPAAIGPHVIAARQQVGNRAVRAGTGFAVNNTDGVERPAQATVAPTDVDRTRPTSPATGALPAPGKPEPPPALVSLPKLMLAGELEAAATASAGALRHVVLPAERGPAESSLDWTGVTPDDQLTIRVDPGVMGTVSLYASFRRGPDSASVQILVNGRKVGEAVELAAPTATVGKFLIGPVALVPGPMTVTLIVTPSRAGAPQRVSLLALSLEK